MERIRGFYRWTVASVNSDGGKCKDFQSTWLSVSLNVMFSHLLTACNWKLSLLTSLRSVFYVSLHLLSDPQSAFTSGVTG